MDSGLKENFPDRVSPLKAHVDSLNSLGAESGPLNPYVNDITSNIVRVCMHVFIYLCVCVCVYVCLCMYACVYVFMYACVYVCKVHTMLVCTIIYMY